METRKEYIALVEAVQSNGGEVMVFSSSHVSGERKFTNYSSRTFFAAFGVDVVNPIQMIRHCTNRMLQTLACTRHGPSDGFLTNSFSELSQLSGVAALLRFPLPDMNEYQDEVSVFKLERSLRTAYDTSSELLPVPYPGCD